MVNLRETFLLISIYLHTTQEILIFIGTVFFFLSAYQFVDPCLWLFWYLSSWGFTTVDDVIKVYDWFAGLSRHIFYFYTFFLCTGCWSLESMPLLCILSLNRLPFVTIRMLRVQHPVTINDPFLGQFIVFSFGWTLLWSSRPKCRRRVIGKRSWLLSLQHRDRKGIVSGTSWTTSFSVVTAVTVAGCLGDLPSVSAVLLERFYLTD